MSKLKSPPAHSHEALSSVNQMTFRSVFGSSTAHKVTNLSMVGIDALMTAAREEGRQSIGAVPDDGVKILVGPNLKPVIKDHLVSLINLIDHANGVRPMNESGDNDRS